MTSSAHPTPAERIAAAATTGLTGPADTPVAEAMAPDILAVPPGASLPDVARTLARERVHAVVVADHAADGGLAPGPWGFVSDLDVVRAAAGEALELPRPAVTVAASATLVAAGRLMGRHEVSHLVVTDESGDHAVGVVSALDVARHIAFGRAER
ncbi:MAG TPA: CBS domain-containing protein [Solirubrobacteraceae bacterium]